MRRFLTRARSLAVDFFAAPASPRPLGFFRIAVSVLALAQVFVLWPYLLQLYGNFGFVQWAIVEAEAETWVPSIGKLCLALQPYGVTSAACVYGVFSLYALGLAGMLVGWRTRPCAVAAWLLHSLTVNSGFISLYGVDTMLHICLFYCAWMPVGDAYSLDAARGRASSAPSFLANLSLRALQIHLCLIYLNTGFAKIRGAQWREGEAVWRALMQPQFSVFDMSWLAQVPWVALLMCWWVIVVELGYAFLIWPRRTRPFCLAAAVALHLGIGLFMGLWMFSLMMIAMNLAAFGFDLLPRPRRAAAHESTLSPSPVAG